VRGVPAAACLLAGVALVACAPAAPVAPAPSADLVLPIAVANGRVEVTFARAYPLGQPARVGVRLLPSSGTLRGPLAPIIQASGFARTALVKRLGATPVTATAGSSARAELVWDTQDEDGTPAVDDDYSLVFEVEDDQGHRTTVGVTLMLRGAGR